jgi:hypothetical protein
MFHGMRNTPKNGTIVRVVEAAIRRRLPPGWTIEVLERSGKAMLRIVGPDRRRVDWLVTVRRQCQPRDVAILLLDPPLPGLVIANYISDAVQGNCSSDPGALCRRHWKPQTGFSEARPFSSKA